MFKRYRHRDKKEDTLRIFREFQQVDDPTKKLKEGIGKVGIPDIVLNKSGRLTDEEYEIIKSHVMIGRNILETSYGNKVNNNILTFAKDIVYHHHEKFDGTGYPEGLKGEQMSIISRIMALIDVYDALAMIEFIRKIFLMMRLKNIYKNNLEKRLTLKL